MRMRVIGCVVADSAVIRRVSVRPDMDRCLPARNPDARQRRLAVRSGLDGTAGDGA